MKKTILALSFLIPTITFAQTQQTKDPNLTITLPKSTWDKIFYLINNTKISYGEAAETIGIFYYSKVQQEDSIAKASQKPITKPEIKKP